MTHRPYAETDEAILIALAQQRDQEAFAELVHRNTSASMRLAISILKDRQEAEDEVQTSFLKAWIHLPRFQSESRFSTWFRTIVMNQSFMRLRQVRRANLRSLDAPDEDGRTMEVASTDLGQEAALGDRGLHEQLHREIHRLPPLMRDVLVLRDLQQLSCEEAAARLGISEPAMKSRLSRARDMLRERMRRHTTATR